MKPLVQSRPPRGLVLWAVFLLATWSSLTWADGGQVLAHVEDAHFRFVLMAPGNAALGEVELSMLVVSLPARLPQTEGVIELVVEQDGRIERIPFVNGLGSNRLLWVAGWQPQGTGAYEIRSLADRSSFRFRGCIADTTFDHRVTLPIPRVSGWWDEGLEAILFPYVLLGLMAAVAGLAWRPRMAKVELPEISPNSG